MKLSAATQSKSVYEVWALVKLSKCNYEILVDVTGGMVVIAASVYGHRVGRAEISECWRVMHRFEDYPHYN